MRHKWMLLGLALLILLPLTASRSDAKGDINFMFGLKHVEEFGDLQQSISGEDDLGNHFDFGVEMTFHGANWPIGIAVDILGSAREEDADYYDSYYYYGYYYTIETSTAEIDVGIRKIWEFPRNPIRPYLGGGLSIARGEVEFTAEIFDPLLGQVILSESDSDDDQGVGYWLGGGVFWRVGQSFNIGLNARYSTADVELFDEDVDVGGVHVGVLLGWGW